MLQRLVDNVLAVAKESVKTFTYESLNNIARLINGISALLLTLLPGKTSILEGIHGWELKPSLRGPRLPRWMENGVSSFNQFIHDLSVDSDDSSNVDYSSDGDYYSDEDIHPATPSSHCSRVSRSSSFSRHDRRATRWIRFIFFWILLPARILIGIPFYFFRILLRRGSVPSSTPESPHNSHLNSIKKAHALKDHIIQRTTDRRRGVIEDLHVATEIIIEAVFDVFHKAAHVVLSPSEAFKILFRPHSYQRSTYDNFSDGDSVPTATLGNNDTSPTERRANFQSMNTDARTCQDVITELGYPYEAIRVETSDGYVLLLERIPRRDSRKVLYLQHGILDSSMGWVSNGVVGSPAFAAYDQGYDVYLGNFRGLVSREHVNKNISSRQYWNYSINEHGTEDIPAMIDKIHQIKVCELGNSETDSQEGTSDEQPYKLCAVCHSLGGAAILMYVITRRIEEKSHRISRLVLLSPAGFHDDSSIMFTLVEYIFLWLSPLLALIIPAFYIPTRFFRMLLNKLARDFHNYPAVGGLVQTLMSYVVGGDSSNWVGVLGIPHYNMNDMPGVSFRVAQHLAQIKRAKKFIMYDYGSPSANMKVYGSPEPLDLGKYYGLIDIPVDLVAGKKDRVIRPSMVKKHYRLLKNAGVEVSYNEYEYAHLDFTFSHHEELLAYVMSRLLLVGPSTKQPSLRNGRSKKRD
uniref:Partial AB-hydrolase lipase domain-containing protein n=1 Tax=Kalanchoe fedtschenkoi TaxID=63787 RepID=A0A7N0VF81_KALFE